MNRIRHQLIGSITIAIICIYLGSGCTTSRTSKPVSLETTIESFYQAEQAQDWRTMWTFAASTFKRNLTYKEFVEEYVKGAKEFSLVSWKILRIEDMNVPLSEFGSKVTRAVKVPMDVIFYDKTTKTTEKSTDQTDYWIQENGRWFWHWRGFPTD